jgi:general secretion pathway protein D
MFKVGLTISLVTLFTLPTLGADVLTVSEFLQRASQAPLQPADAGLLRAVADLVEKEHAVQQRSRTILEPALVDDALPAPPMCVALKLESPPRGQQMVRLQYAPVENVAKALEEFLAAEQEAEASGPRLQVLRQTILVSEPMSNSLLVSSGPKVLDELIDLIAGLDAQPDMIAIKVLIAEVRTANDRKTDEADGNELPSLAEDGAAWLARAKEQGRLEVLSRPQIMTLDNQAAFIQVGESVSIPTGEQSSTRTNVGLILGLTPRVTPKGSVVVEVDLERSRLVNSEGAGTPAIRKMTVHTTVLANDGQTVVLEGVKDGSGDDSRPLIVAVTPRVNPVNH